MFFLSVRPTSNSPSDQAVRPTQLGLGRSGVLVSSTVAARSGGAVAGSELGWQRSKDRIRE